MRRAIVLLTFNEIEALPQIYDRIPFDCAQEVFAVDGGSRDGTREFLAGKGLRVVTQERRGRGVAFRLAAASTSAEALVFFSPDGNEDPADIPRLFDTLETCDMAVASRMMAGAFNEEDIHWFRPRKWVNLALGWIANVLFNRGPFVTDTINGYRAIRRTVLESLRTDAEGFPIEYQMTIRAMKKGLNIREIPTQEGQRLGGQSTAVAIPTGLVFLRLLAREILRGNREG